MWVLPRHHSYQKWPLCGDDHATSTDLVPPNVRYVAKPLQLVLCGLQIHYGHAREVALIITSVLFMSMIADWHQEA